MIDEKVLDPSTEPGEVAEEQEAAVPATPERSEAEPLPTVSDEGEEIATIKEPLTTVPPAPEPAVPVERLDAPAVEEPAPAEPTAAEPAIDGESLEAPEVEEPAPAEPTAAELAIDGESLEAPAAPEPVETNQASPEQPDVVENASSPADIQGGDTAAPATTSVPASEQPSADALANAEAPPPTLPFYRRLPLKLMAAGIAGILLFAGAATWFYLRPPAPRDITVTFLDRNNIEIGKRGVKGERPAAGSASYFLDWAYREAQQITLDKPGEKFIARTTYDTAMQTTAEKIITNQLFTEGPRFKVGQTAFLTLETDGAVRVMVGGRYYQDRPLNYLTEVKRQPGSSFAPYAYLLALEGGAHATETIEDEIPECESWKPKDFTGGRWTPMPLARTLARSVNSVPVQLSLSKKYGGREQLLELLKRLGIEGMEKTCSMAFGDQGITPLSHIAGYAHFASGGKAVRPYAIVELLDKDRKPVYLRARDASPPRQAVDRVAVEKLNAMLRQVVDNGTGKAAALDFTAVAGKTGTSADYKDAWFIGFTGRYVTGVWMGNDDSSATDKLTGGSMPALIWREFNIAAHMDHNIPPIPGVK